MGLYTNFIFPHLMDWLLRGERIRQERLCGQHVHALLGLRSDRVVAGMSPRLINRR